MKKIIIFLLLIFTCPVLCFPIPKDNEVSFDIHPDIHNVDSIVRREAKVVARKKVKSSTATLERRYVIDTEVVMSGEAWRIQLTLTDRREMTYLMLFGREAMNGRFIVDPEHEFILTEKRPAG